MKTECNHEPIPESITIDKKVGKRAICIHCGESITLTRFHMRPGDPPRKSMKITSSDRREAKRRNYDNASKA